ncbi:hypothetical protein GCM10020331_071720 [Ectobacillus funiculus]
MQSLLVRYWHARLRLRMQIIGCLRIVHMMSEQIQHALRQLLAGVCRKKVINSLWKEGIIPALLESDEAIRVKIA